MGRENTTEQVERGTWHTFSKSLGPTTFRFSSCEVANGKTSSSCFVLLRIELDLGDDLGDLFWKALGLDLVRLLGLRDLSFLGSSRGRSIDVISSSDTSGEYSA